MSSSAGCVLFVVSRGVWYVVLGVKLQGALDKFIGMYTHFTGRIETGETAFEVAKRETWEETGGNVTKFFDGFKYTGIEYDSVTASGIVGTTFLMHKEIPNLNAVLGRLGDIREATGGEISRLVAFPIDFKLDGKFYLKTVLETGIMKFRAFLKKDVVKNEEKKDCLKVEILYDCRTSVKEIELCRSSCGVDFWTVDGVICGGFKLVGNELVVSRTKNLLSDVVGVVGLNSWDDGKWYRVKVIS